MSIFNDDEIIKNTIEASKEEVYKWFENNCVASKSIRDTQAFSITEDNEGWVVSVLPIVYRIYIRQNVPTELFKFLDVPGGFSTHYLDNGTISDMSGFPKHVGSEFNITFRGDSLKGCPKTVGGDFMLYADNVTSLIEMPEYIGGKIHIQCNIKDFTGFIKKCNDVVIMSHSLESFKGLENCTIDNLSIFYPCIIDFSSLKNIKLQSLKISFNKTPIDEQLIKQYTKHIPLIIITDETNHIIYYKNEHI